MKEKGYSSLSIEQCEVIKLAVEGAPQEFRINEKCFHGMPPIHFHFSPLILDCNVNGTNRARSN
jgi:hypothetical protein